VRAKGKLTRTVSERKKIMLTLDQLIVEATGLPDADKTILIEKLIESMAEQLDQDFLLEGIQKAQDRLAEIENGTVQAIPGDIALAQIRQSIEP
jgi:hypothetical protein